MANVKIKRVKRNRKKPTAKEKILAGLGVGGVLMGGISAVAPQQQQKEITAKNTAEQSSTGSKIKLALKNIFGSTLGASKALADDTTITSAATAPGGIFTVTKGPNDGVIGQVYINGSQTPVPMEILNNGQIYDQNGVNVTSQIPASVLQQLQYSFATAPRVTATTGTTPTPTPTPTPSGTVNTSGLVLSPNPASPGNFQGSVLINGQQVTVAVVDGVVYGPDGKIAGTPGSVLAGLTVGDTTQIVNAFNDPATINAAGNLTATITSTTNPTSGVTTYTIKIPGTNISISATSISGVGGLNSQMQIYNTSDAGAQRVFAALAQASNNYIAQQNAAGHPVGGTGITATGANGSPYDLTSFVFPPYTESPGVPTQAAIDALLVHGGNVSTMVAARNADSGAYNLYISQLFDDYNYEQGYNNWLISINAGRTAPLPTKPDGFDARQQGQHTTAWTGGGVANNGVPGGSTAQTLTGTGGTSLTFINNTTGNISQLKVGDQWTITVTGPAGSPVYATDSKGNKTLMGTISGTGTLVLGGKVTGDQVGQWTESWNVGSVALPGTVAFNVVVAGSATPTLTFGNTNGGGTAFKVGDSWIINLSGVNVPDGTPVYAIGGVVDPTTGVVKSGQIQLGVIYNGVFQQTTALDLTDAGKWQVSIFVGTGTDQKQIGATQNFTVSDYAVTATTVPATSSGSTYTATISATDSSGNFTVTLNDSNHTKITASSLADLDSQMQKYAGTPSSQNAENQRILASFSAAFYAIQKQNTPAAPVVGNPNPIISTSGAGTLTFSNNLAGSGLGVGNNWVVNVQAGANNANKPVYAYGGVVGGTQGWIFLGTTDSNGNLVKTGPTLGTGDVGSWNVQIMIGNSANITTPSMSNMTQVGSTLSFTVGSTMVSPALYTPTFQQNVQGSGPYGNYSLNPAYYATQDTADWFAAHYGGTVITVNITANWGMFHYPDQLFIQFPDGTAVNAGQLAMAYNIGAGNVDSYTGLLENDEQALAFIRSEKTSHPGTSGVAGGDYGTTDNPEIRNGPTVGNVATSVRFVNKTAGNVNTLAVDDQWEITVTGPNGMNVYVTGGKNGANDTTPKGTITNGTLVLDGKIASGDIGTWLETWRIGASPAQATTIGSFGFTAVATRTTTTGTTGTGTTGTGTTGTGTTGTTTASQSPVISSISSVSVTPGGRLTIVGSNFSATASGNVVDFISGNNIIQASIVSASSTNLAVTVPSNLSLGADYIVRVSPAADPTKVSNTFSVLASGGGGTTGSGTTATTAPSIITTTLRDATASSGVALAVASPSASVAPNQTTGVVTAVSGNLSTKTVTAVSSNSTIAAPTVDSNGVVTIAGVSSGTATVTVHPVAAGTDTSQDKVITVTVAGTSGSTATAPAQASGAAAISLLSMSTVSTGTNVVVGGSNFNQTAGNNIVIFYQNGQSVGYALASAVTPTSLTVTVPTLPTGPYQLLVNNSLAVTQPSNSLNISVAPSSSQAAASVAAAGGSLLTIDQLNSPGFLTTNQVQTSGNASGILTLNDLTGGETTTGVTTTTATSGATTTTDGSVEATTDPGTTTSTIGNLTLDQLGQTGTTTGTTSGSLTLDQLGQTATGTTSTATANDSVEATADTGATTDEVEITDTAAADDSVETSEAGATTTAGSLTLDQLQNTTGATTATNDTIESTNDTGTTSGLTLDQLQQTGTGTTSTTTADDSVESTTDTGITTGNGSVATASGLTMDQLQQTGTSTAGATISGVTPFFLTINPQAGYVGQAYNSAIVAVSNYPTAYTVIAGALPPGLTMSSSGVITGIPKTIGTYNFVVQAITNQNVSSSKQFTLTVNSQQSTVVSAQTGSLSLTDLTSGQAVGNQTFQGLQMPATQGLQMQTQVTASPTPSVQTNSGTYTVKKGDTLWNIAKKYYGDGRKWRVILAANTSKVKSPKTLRIGINLVIPALSNASVQTQVKPAVSNLSVNTLSSKNTAQSQSANTQSQSTNTGQTTSAEQSDLDPG